MSIVLRTGHGDFHPILLTTNNLMSLHGIRKGASLTAI